MQELLDYLTTPTAIHLAWSFFLIFIVFLLRSALNRLIRNQQEILNTGQRLWISNINNASYGIIFIGLVSIWSATLQPFLLSITAIAAALVIATKELLLCLSGGIYRSSSRLFTIGDWIEIQGIKGEVLDRSMLSFTLKELYLRNNLYEYTGRVIIVPNSILLSLPVRNEAFLKNYVFHEFSFTFKDDCPPQALFLIAQESVQKYTESYQEIGKRYMRMVSRKLRTEFMDTAPRIRFTTTDFANNVLTITYFCPRSDALLIEQNLHRDISNFYYRARHADA
jgi:small-conductance mechanosensitive channel